MADPRWDKIKDLFATTAGLSGKEREAFLERHCGANAQMRSFVESLLEDASEPRPPGRGPLSPDGVVSNGTTTAYAPLTEKEGSRIGPYKLLQQIGEGGFGVVFMADQESPVRRRVALKIIKLGMDTRRVVARFEAERQALAMMDHPHIARVLDAGATDSGRPYFVMELVKGDPVTDYCDREHLSIPERLELFTQICNAVQHAHTKGVIHRDIKPSNVLVHTQDGRPHAKIIDFGIAKATDHHLTEKTLFTEHKALIGTPAYMSPEQAEGSLDIDTRTDVYSLGVLLYELLTGTTPFDNTRLREAAYAEMQKIIRETEPQKPSTRLSTLPLAPSPQGEGRGEGREGGGEGRSSSRTQVEDSTGRSSSLLQLAKHRNTEPKKLGPLIRGELDWIVMKALDKDRARRYETANAFSADVRRHLTGEPVIAAPPSAAYRVRKFVKRYKGPVFAASLIGFTLMIATLVSSVFMVRARQAETAQNRARQEADIARGKAQALVDQAAAGLATMAKEMGGETKISMNCRTEKGEIISGQMSIDEYLGFLRSGGIHVTSKSAVSPLIGNLLLPAPEDALTGIIDLGLKSIQLGKKAAYFDKIALVDSYFKANQIVKVREALAKCPEALRNWEWKYFDYISDSSVLLLKANDSAIRAMSFAPDASHFLTAGDDHRIRIWDRVTGHSVKTLEGHTGPILAATYSPDGRWIISGSEDKTIKIWDTERWTPSRPLEGHGSAVLHLAVSPDSRWFISASADHLRMWDIQSGDEIRSIAMDENSDRVPKVSIDKHGNSSPATFRDAKSDPILGVAISPDGKYFFACNAHEVTFWQSDNGEKKVVGEVPVSPLLILGWGFDGKHQPVILTDDSLILTCTFERNDSSWAVQHRGITGKPKFATFRPEGTLIGFDGSMVMFDYNKAYLPIESLTCSAMDSEGRWGIVGGVDGQIALCDLDDLHDSNSLFDLEDNLQKSRAQDIGNGCYFFFDNADALKLTVCELRTNKKLLECNTRGGPLREIAITPDHAHVIAGADDGALTLIDVKHPRSVKNLNGHKKAISGIVTYKDCDHVISGSLDATLRLWSIRRASCLRTIETRAPVSNIALSTDENLVAFGTDKGAICILDATTFQSVKVIDDAHIKEISCLTFSPTGRKILSGSLNSLKTWGSQSGDLLCEQFLIDSVPTHATFLPDEERVLTSSKGADLMFGGSGLDVRDSTTLKSLASLHSLGYASSVGPSEMDADGSTLNVIVDNTASQLRVEPLDEVASQQRRHRRAAERLANRLSLNHRKLQIGTRSEYSWPVERVLEAINSQSEIAEFVRLRALKLVQQCANDDAEFISSKAWVDVSQADFPPDRAAYSASVLEWASKVNPDSGQIHKTMGVAQYRAGKYEQALKTLRKAADIFAKEDKPYPNTLAFIAMCHVRMGHMVDGRTILKQLLQYSKRRISGGRLDGRRLIFHLDNADTEDAQAMVGEGWFELSEDGLYFSGQWRKDGSELWNDWTGFRRPVAKPDRFEGFWSTSAGEMWLVADGDNVGGIYGMDEYVCEAVSLIEEQATATTSDGDQWACRVLSFSTQYEEEEWSAKQALGTPDTRTYGDHASAWAPQNPDGGTQFIALGFENSVYATGVTIRETSCNGFIVQVDTIDEANELRTVWKGIDPSRSGIPVNYFIPFAQTPYLVKGIKIYVNTDRESGYEEIDAVKLHGVLNLETGSATQPATSQPTIHPAPTSQPASAPATQNATTQSSGVP